MSHEKKKSKLIKHIAPIHLPKYQHSTSLSSETEQEVPPPIPKRKTQCPQYPKPANNYPPKYVYDLEKPVHTTHVFQLTDNLPPPKTYESPHSHPNLSSLENASPTILGSKINTLLPSAHDSQRSSPKQPGSPRVYESNIGTTENILERIISPKETTSPNKNDSNTDVLAPETHSSRRSSARPSKPPKAYDSRVSASPHTAHAHHSPLGSATTRRHNHDSQTDTFTPITHGSRRSSARDPLTPTVYESRISAPPQIAYLQHSTLESVSPKRYDSQLGTFPSSTHGTRRSSARQPESPRAYESRISASPQTADPQHSSLGSASPRRHDSQRDTFSQATHGSRESSSRHPESPRGYEPRGHEPNISSSRIPEHHQYIKSASLEKSHSPMGKLSNTPHTHSSSTRNSYSSKTHESQNAVSHHESKRSSALHGKDNYHNSERLISHNNTFPSPTEGLVSRESSSTKQYPHAVSSQKTETKYEWEFTADMSVLPVVPPRENVPKIDVPRKHKRNDLNTESQTPLTSSRHSILKQTDEMEPSHYEEKGENKGTYASYGLPPCKPQDLKGAPPPHMLPDIYSKRLPTGHGYQPIWYQKSASGSSDWLDGGKYYERIYDPSNQIGAFAPNVDVEKMVRIEKLHRFIPDLPTYSDEDKKKKDQKKDKDSSGDTTGKKGKSKKPVAVLRYETSSRPVDLGESSALEEDMSKDKNISKKQMAIMRYKASSQPVNFEDESSPIEVVRRKYQGKSKKPMVAMRYETSNHPVTFEDESFSIEEDKKKRKNKSKKAIPILRYESSSWPVSFEGVSSSLEEDSRKHKDKSSQLVPVMKYDEASKWPVTFEDESSSLEENSRKHKGDSKKPVTIMGYEASRWPVNFEDESSSIEGEKWKPEMEAKRSISMHAQPSITRSPFVPLDRHGLPIKRVQSSVYCMSSVSSGQPIINVYPTNVEYDTLECECGQDYCQCSYRHCTGREKRPLPPPPPTPSSPPLLLPSLPPPPPPPRVKEPCLCDTNACTCGWDPCFGSKVVTKTPQEVPQKRGTITSLGPCASSASLCSQPEVGRKRSMRPVSKPEQPIEQQSDSVCPSMLNLGVTAYDEKTGMVRTRSKNRLLWRQSSATWFNQKCSCKVDDCICPFHPCEGRRKVRRRREVHGKDTVKVKVYKPKKARSVDDDKCILCRNKTIEKIYNGFMRIFCMTWVWSDKEFTRHLGKALGPLPDYQSKPKSLLKSKLQSYWLNLFEYDDEIG